MVLHISRMKETTQASAISNSPASHVKIKNDESNDQVLKILKLIKYGVAKR